MFKDMDMVFSISQTYLIKKIFWSILPDHKGKHHLVPSPSLLFNSRGSWGPGVPVTFLRVSTEWKADANQSMKLHPVRVCPFTLHCAASIFFFFFLRRGWRVLRGLLQKNTDEKSDNPLWSMFIKHCFHFFHSLFWYRSNFITKYRKINLYESIMKSNVCFLIYTYTLFLTPSKKIAITEHDQSTL